MSHEILVKTALKRREVFRNLGKYLKIIENTVRELDSKAEVYLFGSVIDENYNYSSDIDVLVVTRVNPADVHLRLWKAGIKDPFEIHVQTPEGAEFYKNKMKLLEV